MLLLISVHFESRYLVSARPNILFQLSASAEALMRLYTMPRGGVAVKANPRSGNPFLKTDHGKVAQNAY
jgi:hypothetical protein